MSQIQETNSKHGFRQWKPERGKAMMDMELVTVQDCLDMYQKKNMSVLLEDGHVVRFIEETSQARRNHEAQIHM